MKPDTAEAKTPSVNIFLSGYVTINVPWQIQLKKKIKKNEITVFF
jgi:hypothetical protein